MNNRKNTRNINWNKRGLIEKILLHLVDCVDFGCSYKFKKEIGFSGSIFRNLVKTSEKDFKDTITELKRSKFIEKKINYDGSIIISLTDKGKLRALNLRFKRLNSKKEVWDGKWRMVAFDIPDESKKGRNALRYRARIAGFYELQESLFVYPYDCEKEIRDFIKLFRLDKFVRFVVADFIDNQEELEKIFQLKQ